MFSKCFLLLLAVAGTALAQEPVGDRRTDDIECCNRLQVSHASFQDSDGNGICLEKVTCRMITSNLMGDDREEENRSQASSHRVVEGKDNVIEQNVLSNK